MIWLIAKKDFLLNLISIRFIIGFILCLVIIPFTVVISVDDYINQIKVYEVEQKKAEENIKNASTWSNIRPTIVTKPQPLSIFNNGISSNVGNKIQIAFYSYPIFPEGHANTRDNPLLNAFFSIDFSRVIAILISLLALVFSYDTITRERENGTLKLNLTGQVSRISFLFGKLAGLLLTLLPILLFCYILACLIILINPAISFTASEWGNIVLLFVSSVIYMTIFILMGMFISSLVKHSSTSIILSLLCWIWFLFLVPNISTYLSQSIRKTPLYDNVEMTVLEYTKDYITKFKELQMQVRQDLTLGQVWLSHNNYSTGVDGEKYFTATEIATSLWHLEYESKNEQAIFDFADRKWALQQDYLNKLAEQQQLQQQIAWLSPSELFRQITESLCHTSATSFRRYMDNIRNYRENFIRFFRENNLFKSITSYSPMSLDEFTMNKEFIGTPHERYLESKREEYKKYTRILNKDEIPRYVPSSTNSLSGLNEASGRFIGLSSILIFLLIGIIGAFMKYDVR